MNPMNTEGVIAWFDNFHDTEDDRNGYDFLSNFYWDTPIHDGFRTFQTGEHMFAAYKTFNFEQFETIRAAADPQEAKSLGRACDLREDWEIVKYDVMRFVLACKFALGRPEANLLLNTGDALLVEGTYWGDKVWGVDLNTDRAATPQARPGRNWLGALLMARRAELRAEVMHGIEPFSYAHVSRFARGRA